MTAHCHIEVREAAKQIAGMVYDRLMGNDHVYKAWRTKNPGCNARELERRFIEANWGKCLGSAREYLAAQLRNPTLPEHRKAAILDVLEKDASLIRGRRYVG